MYSYVLLWIDSKPIFSANPKGVQLIECILYIQYYTVQYKYNYCVTLGEKFGVKLLCIKGNNQEKHRMNNESHVTEKRIAIRKRKNIRNRREA